MWHEKGSHTVIWYDMIRSCNLEFDLHEHLLTLLGQGVGVINECLNILFKGLLSTVPAM